MITDTLRLKAITAILEAFNDSDSACQEEETAMTIELILLILAEPRAN